MFHSQYIYICTRSTLNCTWEQIAKETKSKVSRNNDQKFRTIKAIVTRTDRKRKRSCTYMKSRICYGTKIHYHSKTVSQSCYISTQNWNRDTNQKVTNQEIDRQFMNVELGLQFQMWYDKQGLSHNRRKKGDIIEARCLDLLLAFRCFCYDREWELMWSP